MSEKEINNFKSNYKISLEIEDLLKFTSGFTFYAGVDELKLTGIEEFGYNGIFKNPLVLAGGDGAGNFWVADTESKESWNRVYFICHNPNAWIIFANSFSEFLKNVIECKGIGKDDKVYEKCFEEDTFLSILSKKSLRSSWKECPFFPVSSQPIGTATSEIIPLKVKR